MLRSIVVKLKSKIDERRSYKELNNLSDAALKDIGVSRGEIKHILKSGRMPVSNLDNHLSD